MTREHLRTTYTHRIQTFEGSIRGLSRILNFLSLARMVTLVAAVWFLVAAIRQNSPVLYGASFLALTGFLLLIALYSRKKNERELMKELKSLNETERSCLNHIYHDLPDGSSFSDPAHPWSDDLDIFGRGSLYQYLNRTSLPGGSAQLAGFLTREPGSPEIIPGRQRLVTELKDELDFRQEFTARGRLLKESPGDLEGISTWLSTKAYILNQKWLFVLALVVSAIALGIIIGGFTDSYYFNYLLPLLLFNFFMLSPFITRSNRYHTSISKKHQLLEGYADLLRLMANLQPDHPELDQAARKAAEGTRKVKQLSRIMGIFDQRLNMLLGVLFNGLFLFDFIMIWLLEKWKEKHNKQIPEWIDITSWCDAVISLAGFAYNHPGFCYPVLEENGDRFQAEELGHPLIPDDRRVDNDLQLEGEKVVVITGANMAGKSTYLRSLGVNMVLAYSGCPVCATLFRSPYSGLFSSMRTADSLRDDESYFLAEIRRLQRIVQRMETGDPLMILLDEVLKGTNTTDKKRGSVGLIRRTLKYPVLCFIATHDLSLGELEKAHKGDVINYCFESYIDDVELTFDYTIRKGIATNMNASFLMKRMGLME